MKEKIKEVEKYFKQKLIDGDFTVKKITDYEIILLIDNKYIFNLWTSNGIESLRMNDVGVNSFMDLQFPTLVEKNKIWTHLNKIIKTNDKEVVLIEKKKQFLKLKKELNL